MRHVKLEGILERLSGQAKPLALAACAFVVLAAMQAGRLALARRAAQVEAILEGTAEEAEESAAALAEAEAAEADWMRQLEGFKAGLPKLAESRRQIYEGGLQLQEEKRLLEKQLEIMTTYLLIDQGAHQVRLMRGEQALETYAIGEDAPRAFGGSKPATSLSVVVSKERFAHPERPKVEQVDAQLQWEPAQVGESARANALGEYVVFGRGSLILHGPPRKLEEHAAYPHVCLELALPVARRLYTGTYMGTKIVIKRAAVAAAKVIKSAAP